MMDCIIVGGGAAGLSAALVLGRAKMNVLVIDENKARNKVTRESHGYLTQDGVSPREFRARAWKDLSKYPTVHVKEDRVTGIVSKEGRFIISTPNDQLEARKIVIATGLQENLPAIRGLSDVYGISVFSCPFCDGWELRNKKLALIGENANVVHMAKLLSQWSADIHIFTNEKYEINEIDRTLLEEHGIEVVSGEILQIVHHEGMMNGIQMITGELVECEGGLVATELYQPTHFAQLLGCSLLPNGGIKTDILGLTSVPGVYAAGDVTWDGLTQLILAAAAGHKAGLGIVRDTIESKFSK